jgi:hypothetical protein
MYAYSTCIIARSPVMQIEQVLTSPDHLHDIWCNINLTAGILLQLINHKFSRETYELALYLPPR